MHPRNDADPIYWKLTPIGYQYGNRKDEKFVATGFYYYHQWGVGEMHDDDLPDTGPYLITNKHVILPPDAPNPDSLHIYLRERRDIRQVTRKTVKLYNADGSSRWRDHPENPNIDIAVVPLNFEVPSASAFHKASIAESATASGGDRIQVIGYPDPLEEFHRLPIQRNALVSSPYKLAYYDNPFFYIDARLHDGMSGSPVLLRGTEVDIDISPISGASDKTKEVLSETELNSIGYISLLGIHSSEAIERNESISLDDIREQIADKGTDKDLEMYLEDLDDRISNIEVESGLNRVWHAKYIDDIIRNI